MSTLRIDILPKDAQKEIQDFYEFLVSKYVHNQEKKDASWQKDLMSVGTWFVNEDDIKLKNWNIQQF
jgi:predicted SprT family Zn-dependent metalloprotease